MGPAWGQHGVSVVAAAVPPTSWWACGAGSCGAGGAHPDGIRTSPAETSGPGRDLRVGEGPEEEQRGGGQGGHRGHAGSPGLVQQRKPRISCLPGGL